MDNESVGTPLLAPEDLEGLPKAAARPPSTSINAPDRAGRERADSDASDESEQSLGDAVAVFQEASLRSTIANVINSIAGSGVLALPYGLMQDGSVFGALMIIAIAALGERTALMLLQAVDETGGRLYSQVGVSLFGPFMSQVVDGIIVVQNSGLLIGYIVIMGQFLPDIVAQMAGEPIPADDDGATNPNPWFDQNYVLVPLLALLVLFPLSAMRNMDGLKFTSILAVGFVTILILFVVVWSIAAFADPSLAPSQNDPAPERKITFFPESMWSFLESVPTIFFAYVAHNAILLLYNELARRDTPERPSQFESRRSKMMFAVRLSLVACTIGYVAVALLGFLLFRDEVDQNILMNFPQTWWTLVLKIAYTLVLVFSFPVIAFALRKSLHSLVFGPAAHHHTWQRWAEAGVITAVVLAVGLAAGNRIEVVFGFTGAVTSTNIMYIMPSAFYLKMASDGKAKDKSLKVFAFLALFVGAFVFVGGVAGSVHKLITGD